MELYLAPTSDATKQWYSEAVRAYFAKPEGERDAGLDAFCALTVQGKAGATEKLDLGTRAAVYDPARSQFRAFWLIPRSSLSKTPMRMANSVGLIDAGYRGVLLGATDFRADFTATAGERYYQIVAADLLPWKAVHIVSEIPGGATLRGEGGFGSTNLPHVESPSANNPGFRDIPALPADARGQQVVLNPTNGTLDVQILNKA